MFTLKSHYRNRKTWQVNMFIAIIFLLFLSVSFHLEPFIKLLQSSLGGIIFSFFGLVCLIVAVPLRDSLSGARRKKFTQFCWLLPLSLFCFGPLATIVSYGTEMLCLGIDLLFFNSHRIDHYISKMLLVSEHLTNMSLFFGLDWNPSIGGLVTAHASLVGCLLISVSVFVVGFMVTLCVYNFCKLAKKVAS